MKININNSPFIKRITEIEEICAQGYTALALSSILPISEAINRTHDTLYSKQDPKRMQQIYFGNLYLGIILDLPTFRFENIGPFATTHVMTLIREIYNDHGTLANGLYTKQRWDLDPSQKTSSSEMHKHFSYVIKNIKQQLADPKFDNRYPKLRAQLAENPDFLNDSLDPFDGLRLEINIHHTLPTNIDVVHSDRYDPFKDENPSGKDFTLTLELNTTDLVNDLCLTAKSVYVSLARYEKQNILNTAAAYAVFDQSPQFEKYDYVPFNPLNDINLNDF